MVILELTEHGIVSQTHNAFPSRQHRVPPIVHLLRMPEFDVGDLVLRTREV